MQVNELETKNLNKEILDSFVSKNLNFNIYGILNNLLFLIKDDSMAVYDLNKCKYLIPYRKGMLKPFVDRSGQIVIASAKSKKVNHVGYEMIDNSWPHVYELTCNLDKNERLLNYSRFNLNGEEYYIGKIMVPKDEFYKEDVLYYKKDAYLDSSREEDLKEHSNFIHIYPTTIYENISYKNREYNEKSNVLKTCDKWDAQSKYIDGLSIIYKNDNGIELYGVVDDEYNIIFDYNTNIKTIKILRCLDLLLLGDSNGLNALYDVKNKKYLIPFKYEIDKVIKIGDNIYKAKVGDKYRLIINNEILNQLYDEISIFNDLIILTVNNETIFINSDNKELYRMSNQKYFISDGYIYLYKNSQIVKHNLYTGVEEILGVKNFYDENGELENLKENSILRKYKEYYSDKDGIHLFKNKKYGVELKSNNVSVNRWYDDKKYVYEFQKSLLESLLYFDKEEQSKKLIKK